MRIHPIDLAIVIAYLLGVTALGVWFRRGQQDARDYFLGGESAPWWALAFSIVATETSTLTIIGTPALSYATNLTFIQLVFGYLVGRVLIVLLLLPGYFRGEYFTAYALIEKRFGPHMQVRRLPALFRPPTAESPLAAVAPILANQALETPASRFSATNNSDHCLRRGDSFFFPVGVSR